MNGYVAYGSPPRLIVTEAAAGRRGAPVTVGWASAARWQAARLWARSGRRPRKPLWHQLPEGLEPSLRMAASVFGHEEFYGIVSSWDDEPCMVTISHHTADGALKMALNAASAVRVNAEAKTLTCLSELYPNEIVLPATRHLDNGVFWIEGLNPLRARDAVNRWAEIQEALVALAANFGPAWTPCRDCRAKLNSGSRRSIWHGDLAPWNVMSRNGDELVLIDWELAAPIVHVPLQLTKAAWDNRRLAARWHTRPVSVTGEWGVAALCFDRYRKLQSGKQDHWTGRVICAPESRENHEYV